MSADNGGSAFPTRNPEAYSEQGMTLRDYFAAQVAVGAMSAYWNGDRVNDPSFNDVAKQAYGIADAMLKARTK
jgi:hypothetical protein